MTASVLIMERKTPARAATRGAGVSNDEVSMQQHKPSVNEHFKAAIAQAKHLPHILTPKVKHAQQQGILRSLLAGLKGGKS